MVLIGGRLLSLWYRMAGSQIYGTKSGPLGGQSKIRRTWVYGVTRGYDRAGKLIGIDVYDLLERFYKVTYPQSHCQWAKTGHLGTKEWPFADP